MAVIQVNVSKSIGNAINYGYGKNKLDPQDKKWLGKNSNASNAKIKPMNNRAIVQGSIGLSPKIDLAKHEIKASFQMLQGYKPKRKNANEGVKYIQSFSPSEFSSTNVNDWYKVNQLGKEFVKQAAPNHQALVFTHFDSSKGNHILHNHIVVNVFNSKTGNKYHHHKDIPRLRKINDQIMKNHGFDNQRTMRKHANIQRTKSESHLAHRGKYVWKDDLRSRIDRTMLNKRTIKFSNFTQEIKKHGVTFHDRNSSSSFSFIDKLGNPRRIRGYHLGQEYTKEAIKNGLARKAKFPQLSGKITANSRRITKQARAINDNSKTIRNIGAKRPSAGRVHYVLGKQPNRLKTPIRINPIEVQTITPDLSNAQNKEEVKEIINETKILNQNSMENAEYFNKELAILNNMLFTSNNIFDQLFPPKPKKYHHSNKKHMELKYNYNDNVNTNTHINNEDKNSKLSASQSHSINLNNIHNKHDMIKLIQKIYNSSNQRRKGYIFYLSLMGDVNPKDAYELSNYYQKLRRNNPQSLANGFHDMKLDNNKNASVGMRQSLHEIKQISQNIGNISFIDDSLAKYFSKFKGQEMLTRIVCKKPIKQVQATYHLNDKNKYKQKHRKPSTQPNNIPNEHKTQHQQPQKPVHPKKPRQKPRPHYHMHF